MQTEICTVCCATGREETIDCPLDCTYLGDAHRHEKPVDDALAEAPNQDIAITEEFIRENEILLAFLAVALYEGALTIKETGTAGAGATDWDVRDALAALIKTWRTLENGIFFESRPENAFAAGIAAHVQRQIEEVRNGEIEKQGATSLPERTVLTTLAFLQRIEYNQNNGRRRSRAFLDFLASFYRPEEERSHGSGILQPGSLLIDPYELDDELDEDDEDDLDPPGLLIRP